MKLEITTDLTKITIKFFISFSATVNDERSSSYNIMCILLDENNKIVKSNYICDKRNGSFNEDLVSLGTVGDKEDVFHLNLIKMPEEVKYISFFLTGDLIGSAITGVDAVSFDFMDKNEKRSFANVELSLIHKDSKCIHLCKIYRKDDNWSFREVCKPVKLNDIFIIE